MTGGTLKRVTKLREQDRAKATAPIPPPPVIYRYTLAIPPSLKLNSLTYQQLNSFVYESCRHSVGAIVL